MAAAREPAGAEEVLVLAPAERDGVIACEAFAAQGILARRVADVEELCRAIVLGTGGAALLSEECLGPSQLRSLRASLVRQPAWSDFPLLVLASRRSPATRLDELGNVTLLDPPLRMRTMVRTVRSALRSRRRQYEGRAAIQQRDRFLAMLGHELRNPLAAISLALEVAEEGDLTRAEAVVRRQVAQLTRLVDDLLDVARVSTGKLTLRRQPMDLAALVRRLIAGLEPRFRQAELALEAALPGELPIHGDAARIEQIVGNLLGNALKYTPAGGLVELRLRREGPSAVLRLRDSGIGIAPEMVPRMFEPFVQGDASLERAEGGLGVGLALVRALAELHGGSVDATSPGIGGGSTFVLRLPVDAPPAGGGAEPRTARRREAGPRRSIVIVEDNDDSRELLARVLSAAGHTVRAARDGDEGLALLRARVPDAAIIDLGLPKIDGFEMAAHVRRELGRAPLLIALSGYGQPEDKRRALDVGFDVHMTKPADLSHLLAVLELR